MRGLRFRQEVLSCGRSRQYGSADRLILVMSRLQSMRLRHSRMQRTISLSRSASSLWLAMEGWKSGFLTSPAHRRLDHFSSLSSIRRISVGQTPARYSRRLRDSSSPCEVARVSPDQTLKTWDTLRSGWLQYLVCVLYVYAGIIEAAESNKQNKKRVGNNREPMTNEQGK